MNYKVADYLFDVLLPQGMDERDLLPSFRGLVYRGESDGSLLFRFDATATGVERGEEAVLLDESVNDMGCVKVWSTEHGYCIEAHHELAPLTHTLTADREFRSIKAAMQWEDPYVGQMLCSMLRIVFSQAILHGEGIGIHASAVAYKGKGYLFLGKSGTGKSTHAALWLQHVVGTERINDDNPILRIVEGKAYVYGSPWSGKTPCYKDVCYPIGGIVRLEQAPVNQFHTLTGVEAFIALVPGCAVIKQDKRLYAALCEKLIWLAEHVTIGKMACRPDREAAMVCENGFSV